MNKLRLHSLQKAYVPAVLNKMGFSRTYAQAMVFGPRSHGAIEGIDLRSEQGIQIIDNLMRTLRTPGNGQSMVKVFLITFQHVSGCQLPLLQYPQRRAPHLEGYLFPYLRQFLSDSESSMKVDCVKPLQIERDDD